MNKFFKLDALFIFIFIDFNVIYYYLLIQVCVCRDAAHRRHLDGRQHGRVEPPGGLGAHVPLPLHRRPLLLRRRRRRLLQQPRRRAVRAVVPGRRLPALLQVRLPDSKI